ncbi:lipoprotein [Helicobacter fennelliae]|nr:lysophospholipid acyltransferase family protein [Helicobacter fennelliae]SQB97982.1 lipoprotein [Helicobacter fennelliae]STP06808.1 lipoprotein [Helicobacter fennelliae]STQ83639.1 lipoprotein [Helicobacter fennelliae]
MKAEACLGASKEARMNLKQKMILFFVPRLGYCLVWILYALNRHRFVIDTNLESDNVIIAFWHGEILMMPFLYRKLRKKPNVYIIASSHFDGGLIANMCELFGMKVIRGSTNSGGSNRGGVRVLIESFKALNDGYDVGVAMDGPRGPYHQVADGMMMMAQKTGKKITICRIFPSRYYEFKTWDRFKLPLPFGKIHYFMNEGFSISRDLSLEQARQMVNAKISQTEHKE